MAFPVLTYALVLVVLGFLARKYQAYQFNKKYKLPPRIPGIPVFGNTLQLPPLKQGLWGVEMAKKYGEMYVNVILPALLYIHLPTPIGSHVTSAGVPGSSSTPRESSTISWRSAAASILRDPTCLLPQNFSLAIVVCF